REFERFSRLGGMVRGSPPRDGANWMVLTYADRAAAERALALDQTAASAADGAVGATDPRVVLSVTEAAAPPSRRPSMKQRTPRRAAPAVEDDGGSVRGEYGESRKRATESDDASGMIGGSRYGRAAAASPMPDLAAPAFKRRAAVDEPASGKRGAGLAAAGRTGGAGEAGSVAGAVAGDAGDDGDGGSMATAEIMNRGHTNLAVDRHGDGSDVRRGGRPIPAAAAPLSSSSSLGPIAAPTRPSSLALQAFRFKPKQAAPEAASAPTDAVSAAASPPPVLAFVPDTPPQRESRQLSRTLPAPLGEYDGNKSISPPRPPPPSSPDTVPDTVSMPGRVADRGQRRYVAPDSSPSLLPSSPSRRPPPPPMTSSTPRMRITEPLAAASLLGSFRFGAASAAAASPASSSPTTSPPAVPTHPLAANPAAYDDTSLWAGVKVPALMRKIRRPAPSTPSLPPRAPSSLRPAVSAAAGFAAAATGSLTPRASALPAPSRFSASTAADEELAQLLDMFPDLPVELVRKTYESEDWDLARAKMRLLEAGDVPSPAGGGGRSPSPARRASAKASLLRRHRRTDDVRSGSDQSDVESRPKRRRLVRASDRAAATAASAISVQNRRVAATASGRRPRRRDDDESDNAMTDDMDDLLGKLQAHKRKKLGGLVEKYQEITRAYSKVDVLIRDCEKVGEDLMVVLRSWKEPKASSDEASGTNAKATDVSDSLLQSQPTLLNPSLHLKGYQLVGVSWIYLLFLKGCGGILADEMGLGKTAQVISFISLLKEKGEDGPHLIIVPSSTIENWLREFQRWAPSVEVLAYYGTQSERGELRNQLEDAPGDVSLLTFILPDLFRDSLNTLNMIFGAKGAAGSDPNSTLLSHRRIVRARGMMAPFVLRRKKADVLTELPAKIRSVEYCDPTDTQRALYESIVADMKKHYLSSGDGAQEELAKGTKPSKSPRRAATKRAATKDSSSAAGGSNILMQLRKAAIHPLLFRRL
ncbi:hypothetical protein HK405_007689, partial [Cladochytrium tenue]